MKDFYYILGLDVHCTANEIREAYRKLSKKFHPDLNQQDNYFENRFKDIRQAYETLIDPAGRTAYDSMLKKHKSSPVKTEPTKHRYANTTKSIDIAFTIILIVFTFIFGNYVIKNITGSKSTKITKVAAMETNEKAEIRTVKHHKKKHGLVAMRSENLVKTANASEIQPAVISQLATMAEVKPVIKQQAKPAIITPAPVITQQPITTVKATKPANIIIDDNILTGAYIKANSTGIVYMRAEDNYNAAIVSRIPGNSRIAILEKGDSFYKIEYNSKTGYVPKWTVKND